MIMKKRFIASLVLAAGLFYQGVAQEIRTLKVNTDKPVSEVQKTMWGIFFEDINFAADGGIYAELVKNRSFEFDEPLMGWKEHSSERFAMKTNAGKAMILNRGQGFTNPRFARLGIIADKGYGLTNEGFRGMGFRKDNAYDFSILARQMDGNTTIRVELIDSKGTVIGSTTITPTGNQWKKYTATLTAASTEAKGQLNVWFDGKGVLDVDMISLFPRDTWKNRPGGMRKDLVQLLADLKPGFLRFPGGCIVEGRDLSQRYQWKKTVGNVEDRELLINRWNTEFSHRKTPDYYQTFGLGFFEYFLLAEDIGAEPLPILSCGLACQFNTAEVAPLEELEPFVQDALDLIEFANGDVSTKWGKLRADMGHPAPFNMKFIGVGNEQWGPQYIERYKVFEKAIKSKYPSMLIVSGTGPFPDGEMFDYALKELRALKADVVDEHYYAKPEWFFQNVTRYDKYDRKGPKVFAGEYAAQSKAIATPDNKNNWECALSEAAFMTGLERNADVVHLCSYAPLFAHAEGWQWTPDLIWFDNLSSYGTPNYYVQKLYSNNKGTHVLNVRANDQPLTGQDNIYASAVWDQDSKQVIVKIVNSSSSAKKIDIQLDGAKKYSTSATVSTLTSASPEDVNSFEKPENIKPVESAAKVKGKSVTLDLKPKSLTVLRVTAK
jgi:alpha-L-arabinofuranosidase